MAESSVNPLHVQLGIIANNLEGYWHDLAQKAMRDMSDDKAEDAWMRKTAHEEAQAIRRASDILKGLS